MEKYPYPPEELVALAAELACKYAGCDTTSLPYEKAQDLLEAILYHLDAYARWADERLPANHLSAKAAYQAGFQCVLEKMQQLTAQYNQLINDFNDYGLWCLRDTVRHALPEFLRRYDARFCPQDMLVTLDYPTIAPFYGLEGVDKAYQYTMALTYEQAFLRQFPEDYIVAVLRAYHPEYHVLVENISVIILQNTIGHLWLAKPLTDCGFTDEEWRQLRERLAHLTPAMAEDMVSQYSRALCPQDEAVRWYIGQAVPDIAARLRESALHGHLKHCFVW